MSYFYQNGLAANQTDLDSDSASDDSDNGYPLVSPDDDADYDEEAMMPEESQDKEEDM